MTYDVSADPASRFEHYVLSGVDRLKARGYNPTLFLRLVREHGGAVNAAKILLGNGKHTSYGFERLWEMGELESSIEFAVSLPWFRSLFTPDEQDEAERRLLLHDFPVKRRLRALEQSPPDWVTR
ncbi:MAG: hypothetical protein JWO67_7095 [Streptosporangiaceae bacterium]|nr:hypothetical protein [Streptosporangiaceae bacterium]